MLDGVFSALVVAGLFLLVLAVVVGTVVVARRGRPIASPARRPPLGSDAVPVRSDEIAASRPDGPAGRGDPSQ